MVSTMKIRASLLAMCAACSTAGSPDESPASPATPAKAAGDASTPVPDAVVPQTQAPDAAETTLTPIPKEPIDVDEADLAKAAQSIDAFSIDLYARIATTPGNLVVSPASIAIAFGMTHAGAKGKTAEEMATVLHVSDSGLDSQQWHTAMGGLLAQWNGLKDRERPDYMPELKLSVANRLFGDKAAKFHAAYLDGIARDYRAPMEPVDYRTAFEPARQRINTWVEEQTYDRIKNLVPSGGVNADTRLVLVNAVYFKAQWMNTFSESATSPAPFFVDGTNKHDVPMMSRTGYIRHGSVPADGVVVVELPYENGPFAMDIIMPSDRAGLPALEAKLDMKRLQGWLDSTRQDRVDLKLPKFRIDPPDPLRLSATLRDMGMPTAFTEAADFTGMAPKEEQLMISEAFHKAFIEVDEKGTEAAAATAVVMRAGGAPPSNEPIPIAVDRPFLFVVRDTASGAILFMGRVADPR